MILPQGARTGANAKPPLMGRNGLFLVVEDDSVESSKISGAVIGDHEFDLINRIVATDQDCSPITRGCGAEHFERIFAILGTEAVDGGREFVDVHIYIIPHSGAIARYLG